MWFLTQKYRFLPKHHLSVEVPIYYQRENDWQLALTLNNSAKKNRR